MWQTRELVVNFCRVQQQQPPNCIFLNIKRPDAANKQMPQMQNCCWKLIRLFFLPSKRLYLGSRFTAGGEELVSYCSSWYILQIFATTTKKAYVAVQCLNMLEELYILNSTLHLDNFNPGNTITKSLLLQTWQCSNYKYYVPYTLLKGRWKYRIQNMWSYRMQSSPAIKMHKLLYTSYRK